MFKNLPQHRLDLLIISCRWQDLVVKTASPKNAQSALYNPPSPLLLKSIGIFPLQPPLLCTTTEHPRRRTRPHLILPSAAPLSPSPLWSTMRHLRNQAFLLTICVLVCAPEMTRRTALQYHTWVFVLVMVSLWRETKARFEPCDSVCQPGLCVFEGCSGPERPACVGGACTFRACHHPSCEGKWRRKS